MTWEYQAALPDRDPEKILETVKQRATDRRITRCRNIAPAPAEAAFKTGNLQAHYPGLVMDEGLPPAVRLGAELTGANQAEAVSYGTEAGTTSSN